MNLEYRKLSIGLILLYAACMIFTAYILFQLQGTLVYESQVLSLAEMNSASPVFTELYLAVGVTLFIGLTALLIAQNKKNSEVIYVEKKKSSTVSSDEENEATEEGSTFDLKILDAMAENTADELKLTKEILVNICKHLEAGIGIFYKATKENDRRILEVSASYALTLGESQTIKYEFGEGLVGQAALAEKTLIIDDVPEGYVKIVSGLGNAAPAYLLIVPVKIGSRLYGVVEIASFTKVGENEEKVVNAAFSKLTKKLAAGEKKDATASDKQSKQDKKSGSVKKNNKA